LVCCFPLSMLLSTVAAGCIYGECIQLGGTSSLSCFCVGLFLVLLANQQILFFLFVWLALWVLCSLPTCMSLCLGSLLPVSLCVSNSLALPLVCISDMYFLHLFYCPFIHTKLVDGCSSCCWCAAGILYIFIYFVLGALLGALVGASGLFFRCLALVQARLRSVPLLCLVSIADTVLRLLQCVFS
jgi:hypothetical protein